MRHNTAFTLIELSIVLVIIGLIVGGVLIGQDLIRAAQVRATISQIEKFQQATNTFRGKYGALPGDISPALVIQFGFTVAPGSTRAGTTAGLGNNDGMVQGYNWGAFGANNNLSAGETAWFWEDLSSNTGLIEGGFNSAPGNATPGNMFGTFESLLVPVSKINGSIYVYVYLYNSQNYFGLSATTGGIDNNGAVRGIPGLTIMQAYQIDKKIDDGLPQSGSVTAQYQNWNLESVSLVPTWSQGPNVSGPSDTSALAGNATTCFDNGGNAGVTQTYSLTQNNGNGANCGLSFRFQ